MITKMSKFKCHFQDEWLSSFQWLRTVPNDPSSAYCDLCRCKFSLSNMGLTAVNSHRRGKKHQSREKSALTSPSIGVFLRQSSFSSTTVVGSLPSEIVVSPEESPGTSSQAYVSVPLQSVDSNPCRLQNSSLQDSHRLHGMDKYLLKESITRAEVTWCLEAVMTHKSLRSAEKDVKAFPKMFPDSAIAKGMQLGRDKIAYTIVYGIAILFKQNLMDDASNCTHLVIGFDESLNKVAQKQQMDVNVRFWGKGNEVKTRYLTSAFLQRTRASDLLSAFLESIRPLDVKKVLQVSMDGPNVNVKFFKDLKSFTKGDNNDAPEILDMGSCGLHALNGAFKTGANATGWELLEFHRALYFLFKDSPARRALLKSYSQSDLLPLKFCSVRWLENSGVAERSLEMLPSLKLFVEGVVKEGLEPKSKSYLIVKSAIRDELLPAKLTFFRTIAAELEGFLREFQTDAPLAPFLYCSMSTVMRRLMQRFVVKEVLEAASSVMNVHLDDKNLILAKDVSLGIATQSTVRKSKGVSDKDIFVFRNGCRNFLLKCVGKLKTRSPLIYELTKAASCFDPSVALKPKMFSQRLNKLLLILTEKNWLHGINADKAKQQLEEICSKPHAIEAMKSYKRSTQRLDHFWHRLLIVEEDCPQAIEVMKMVMLFSHGNANLERGFSINKDCLWENMKEQSLVSRRMVYDHVLDNGGLLGFEITKPLILSVRNARARFAEVTEQRRKDEKEKHAAKEKKRHAALQVRELEAKKAKIMHTAQNEAGAIEDEIRSLQKI